MSTLTTIIQYIFQSLSHDNQKKNKRNLNWKSKIAITCMGPQGEWGLEFSRRKKEQMFIFSLHSLELYNNNVSCWRTVSGKKKKNLLANPVILKCKLWEWV